MKAQNTYLVSAPGWPMKYIRANTVEEARAIWRRKTGGPNSSKVSQVLGEKPKPKHTGGDK